MNAPRALAYLSLITAVGVGALAPSHVLAQPASGTIVGKITANDSTPLAGARVVIVGTGSITSTDSAGNFVIQSPPPGSHVIELWHAQHDMLRLPALKMPARDTFRVTAMLARTPQPGREADSVRAAALARGGRGQDPLPIVLIDGVIQTGRPPADTTRRQNTADLDVVSVEILTGNPAMQMYGSMARFGVISIATLPPPCPPGVTRTPRMFCRQGG